MSLPLNGQRRLSTLAFAALSLASASLGTLAYATNAAAQMIAAAPFTPIGSFGARS